MAFKRGKNGKFVSKKESLRRLGSRERLMVQKSRCDNDREVNNTRNIPCFRRQARRKKMLLVFHGTKEEESLNLKF